LRARAYRAILKGLFDELRDLIARLYQVSEEYQCLFEKSDEFSAMFGEADCTGMLCVKPCNMDVIFDNIIIGADGRYQAYDYEWVCDCAVPQKYVIYRVLCNFYDKYFGYLSPRYSFETYISQFDFTDYEKSVYRRMEDSFIQYVYAGGNPALNNDAFHTKRVEFDELVYKYKDYDNVLKLLHDTEAAYINCMEENSKAAETISAFVNSTSWKITRPVRSLKNGMDSLRERGLLGTIRYKLNQKRRPTNSEPGGAFYDEYRVEDAVLEKQRREKFKNNIRISIATPLYNTPEIYLRELLDSVKNQSYENWELCLVNFSDGEHGYVDEICRSYADEDARFSYHRGEKNRGISENTNECISYATGEFIGLLDHDDVLHPSALYEVVKRINDTGADFVYTDEIKFEEDTRLAYAPNFKPDFSRYELLAHNYICHFNVYAKSLYDEAGGYRKAFDGSQDHDIVLRITDIAKHIEHIDKILYFWRVHEGSVALNIGEKSYATRAGELAVTEQVKKTDTELYAESIMNNIPCYRLKGMPKPGFKCSVIIWGGCKKNDRLKKAMSLLSDDVSEISFGADSGNADWNQAVNAAKHEYIFVLNGALSDISADFLCQGYMYMINDDVASVDAGVLTADDKILSGGLRMTGDADMPFMIRCKGKNRDYYGYENDLMHARVVAASLGCAAFIKKSVWNELYDAELMDGAGAIIMYAYIADRNGMKNIWTPFIEAKAADETLPQELERVLSGLKGKADGMDCYVSDKIYRYGLE
jgi:glycosyltransferase involved in cell wall biosynthesis